MASRSSPAGPAGRLPRAGAVDSTAALLREGYVFGLRRFRRYDTDVFGTRLMGANAVVAYGEEAAAEFYRPDRMTRR